MQPIGASASRGCHTAFWLILDLEHSTGASVSSPEMAVPMILKDCVEFRQIIAVEHSVESLVHDLHVINGHHGYQQGMGVDADGAGE